LVENKIDQAVIFCGGFGTRLKKITKKTPKPLLKFDNVIFLDYVICNLAKYGFKKILLLCHYKSHFFIKRYNQKNILGMTIECVIEKTPLGTGGSLYNAKNFLDNTFMICNGDTYCDFNLFEFKKKFNKKSNILVGIKKIENNFKFKKVIVKNKKIKFFSDKPCNKNDYFNTGFSILKKSFIKKINQGNYNLEKDYLNLEVKKRSIDYYEIKDELIDIGTVNDFNYAKNYFKKRNLSSFLILDRDGVINYDTGHLSDYVNIKYIDGIVQLIKLFNLKNIPIFVVTNQSAVARGYMSENKLNKINWKIMEYFKSKNCLINRIYYCPHHVESKILKYKKKCKFRKPNNNFFHKIKKDWFLKSNSALMIGDQHSDMLFADKSKINGILFDKPSHNIFKAMNINHKFKKFLKAIN
jgi:D,D-heptose 1,7-bisphosphate phosphatase|tara:strand:- start:676 stop:1908 length:1233 start_codon:yes stop_codon:yes gene_type:complete